MAWILHWGRTGSDVEWRPALRSISALLLLPLFGCQAASQVGTQSVIPIMEPAAPTPYPQLAWLAGLTASEVIARLGAPAVNNIVSDKQLLDYQSASCDFSIFLRPDASGQQRVHSFFALSKSGQMLDLQPCWSEVFPQHPMPQ